MINSTHPEPVKEPGFPNAFTTGITRPAPMGIQKFDWNPHPRTFDTA